MSYWHEFLQVVIPLFVAIDPIGLLPLFLGLTAGMGQLRRRQIAFEAVGTATLVSLGFVLIGRELFVLLGIDQADFMIGGGVLLLVLSVLDLLMVGKPAVDESALVGIVPLATPLIAGPATLTTALVLASGHGYGLTVLGLVINFAILLVMMLSADRAIRWIGRGTLQAISKLVMILLAAIAINYIRMGVVGVIAAMKHS
jgi:multiple antibiotic resistance protein